MKRILISNGRSPITLDFIRTLAYAGHEIYVTETSNLHLSRFSNCVKKCFVVPSPRFSPKEHINELIGIVERENIDLFVPAWEDVFLVSKYLNLFPVSCFVLSSEHNLLHELHHKGLFIKLLEKLNIKTPKTIFIQSEADLQYINFSQYALKACYSRASQNVFKIKQGDALPPIKPTKEAPWIAQEWLDGQNFCTFSLCHKGVVHAHATYPVDFTMKQKGKLNSTVGSYCMTFRSLDHEPILNWVKEFTKKTNYTGQLAFDFIELPNGELFTIECNPRITSGITLFSKESEIAKALFGDNTDLVKGDPSIRKQITMGMLMYGWQSAINCKKLPLFWNYLFNFKDLVFHKKDPLPFFAQAFLWLKHITDIRRYKKRLQGAFTHDLDFNGENSLH